MWLLSSVIIKSSNWKPPFSCADLFCLAIDVDLSPAIVPMNLCSNSCKKRNKMHFKLEDFFVKITKRHFERVVWWAKNNRALFWQSKHFYSCMIFQNTMYIEFHLSIKVHIFWKGHKILQNLHLTFDCVYCGQK